jgi:tripartite-type tricarboxylate transporter receptor subunit TctC
MSLLARIALVATASVGLASSACALTLVVPFARGGGADFVAQRLLEVLPAALGEPVTLDYRPGDDGLTAADEMARAAPDGSALLLGSTASLMFAPLAKGRMPYDPAEDFEPVALVSSVPRLVLVHPSVAARNLDQLIRLAREQKGKLTCGTSDQLSQHAVRLFEQRAGVKLDCVHYDGGAALRPHLMSGKVQFAIESFFLPEAQSGHLRAIAVAAPGRMRALPDVPTTLESGLPGVEAVAWHALFAPKGTDRARLDALTAAVGKALQQPAFASAMEARGYVVRPMTAPQMRHYLQRDLMVWRRPS